LSFSFASVWNEFLLESYYLINPHSMSKYMPKTGSLYLLRSGDIEQTAPFHAGFHKLSQRNPPMIKHLILASKTPLTGGGEMNYNDR
jgi:hypothetical protein